MTAENIVAQADEFPPPGRCDGCAFTPGTPANLSPLTLTKARLSAMLADPFYCHRNLVGGAIPEGQAILCAGWADMVGGLYTRGAYDVPAEGKWRQGVLRACLSAVIAIEDRLLAGEDVDDLVVSAELRRWLEEIAP